jgi:hypothetical protein
VPLQETFGRKLRQNQHPRLCRTGVYVSHSPTYKIIHCLQMMHGLLYDLMHIMAHLYSPLVIDLGVDFEVTRGMRVHTEFVLVFPLLSGKVFLK